MQWEVFLNNCWDISNYFSDHLGKNEKKNSLKKSDLKLKKQTNSFPKESLWS